MIGIDAEAATNAHIVESIIRRLRERRDLALRLHREAEAEVEAAETRATYVEATYLEATEALAAAEAIARQAGEVPSNE